MNDIAERYRHIIRYHFHEELNVTETTYRIWSLRAWCPKRTCDSEIVFASETLVLKTRSDRVAPKRWTQTKSQLWWTYLIRI